MIAVGAISLLSAAVLGLFGDELEEIVSPQANGFSRSAIGHHAFLETLRKLGIPVVVSRYSTASKLGRDSVLLLLEPDVTKWDATRSKQLDAMTAHATRVLVVLPKRTGAASPLKPRWLARVQSVASDRADGLLSLLDVDGTVTRLDKPAVHWTTAGRLPTPTLTEPQLFLEGDDDEGTLTPLVTADEGMLAGERDGDGVDLMVIADPDVISTYGLGKGQNAALAVALLERLRKGAGTVVVDETLHGFDQEPSIGRELLRFPLVLALLQTLLAGAALIWAGMGRFGKPAPTPPAFAPGKEVLIANTAELLRYGGHLAHAVRRYWRITQEQLARDLHAPQGLDPAAFQRWLERAAAARGAGQRLARLESRVATFTDRHRSEQEALSTGLAIHRFREDMIDGSRNHPRHQ
jgi:hypothetical protein